MYDELVKRLRAQAVYLPEKFSKNAELLDVLMKAADAIEKLQKRVPPVPHGDLIERNALIKQARTQFDWNDVVDVEDIANAPTIIPAEEGE